MCALVNRAGVPHKLRPVTLSLVSMVLFSGLGCVSDINPPDDGETLIVEVVASLGDSYEFDLQMLDIGEDVARCTGMAETTTCQTILFCPTQLDVTGARQVDDEGNVLEEIPLTDIEKTTLVEGQDYTCEQITVFDATARPITVTVRNR